MTDPVSRTILLLDIERFSDRDDVEQAYLRRMLYDITDRTLQGAGIDETRRLRADRGDSVMELIDANAPVTALLRALLTDVPAHLRSLNRMASRSAQIRLRGVVATGYVAVDEHDGWVGSDLNHACRLLDAALLRDALRERADDFALCVSDALYTGVVRHDHVGVPAADFHPVTMESKNGPLKAWLHGPVPGAAATDGREDHGDTGAGEAPGGSGDRPAPRGDRAAEEGPAPRGTEAPEGGAAPRGARAPEDGPAPGGSGGAPAPGPVVTVQGGTFSGGVIGGSQYGGISGGHFSGDVVLGEGGGHERGEGGGHERGERA